MKNITEYDPSEQNAIDRYNTYFDIIDKSSLTDKTEIKKLAKDISLKCIDVEIEGHTAFWKTFHSKKIARLLNEKLLIAQM